MTFGGEYIFKIVLAAIFVSILRLLLPDKGPTASIIRLVASVFIVMVAIKPFVNIRINDTIHYFTSIEADASDIISAAQAKTGSEIAEVINEKSKAYISDMALELGAELDVRFEIQKSSPFNPEYVTIVGAVSPAIREKISGVLEKEFNLPKEAQSWKLSE